MSSKIDVLVITGLSGAGRSHVGSVLEDVGYFVVDNLPPKMIIPLVDLMMQPGVTITKLGAVVDIRSRQFFADFNSTMHQLRTRGVNLKITYVEADTDELVKRYERVRRPHPLQNTGGGIIEAINQERQILNDLRTSSDLVIDTTKLSIHDLSRKILELLSEQVNRKLQIHVQSFGFKHGIPLDTDFVADMRWLPNPFWVDELQNLTGQDDAVVQYVMQSQGASEFLEQYVKLVSATFASFLQENKPNLTIAFGCTGGKHRSVAIASLFTKQLQQFGYTVTLTNRDINKE